MVWYSCLLKSFPQFVVIHTVKGFSVVSEAEVDVFFWNSLAFSMIQWSPSRLRRKFRHGSGLVLVFKTQKGTSKLVSHGMSESKLDEVAMGGVSLAWGFLTHPG